MKLIPSFVIILFATFTLGCQSPTEAPLLTKTREQKMQNNKGQENKLVDKDFTHSVAHPTAYYNDGPQQARPADGTLAVGTKIKIIKSSGSYALIESNNGVNAYVAMRDLEKN